MLIDEIFPSRFFRPLDLNGSEISLEIDSVEIEDFEGTRKPVLSFRGERKKLALNKTNSVTIAEFYGRNTDDWVDKPVIVDTMAGRCFLDRLEPPSFSETVALARSWSRRPFTTTRIERTAPSSP